jgi:hypothetical protein
MPARDVTIGIPACDDDPAVLDLALRAIAQEEGVGERLLVDMSRGDAIERLARDHPAIRYERIDAAGVAAVRNRLVELAATRYLLFVDADAVPRAGWATALARPLAEGATLAGARILPRWPRRPPPLLDTTTARELLGNLDCGDAPLPLPRVMGTSFGADLERLPPAPFDPATGHRPGRWTGREEVALSLDVLAAGGRIAYAPDAVVDHHLRPERTTWAWMLRRIRHEGRDRGRYAGPLEPFPRKLRWDDAAFRLATTPAFLAGRLQGPER